MKSCAVTADCLTDHRSSKIKSTLSVTTSTGNEPSIGKTWVEAAWKILILVERSPSASRLERKREVLKLLADLLDLQLFGLLLCLPTYSTAQVWVNTAEES